MLIGVIAEALLWPSAIREAASAHDQIIPLAEFVSAIAESATAADDPTTGVVFAALVDDPAWASDSVSALVGQLMSEAASAADTISVINLYSTTTVETASATDAPTGTVVAGTATWNPSDKSAVVTLSNGNLTATSGGGAAGVRSTKSVSAGKGYFEVTFVCGTIGSATSSGCGIANSAAVLISLWGAGGGQAAWVELANGHIWVNNADSGTVIGTPTSGQTICVAVDFTNLRFWARINAGNWNGSGTANPATNVGGVSIPGFSGVSTYVSGSVQGAANFVTDTVNFGATAFTQTVPSGFSSWAAL